jgi:hypothetical protein
MSLRLNPIYEKMLPTMTQEEFEQLKESIRTEGQHTQSLQRILKSLMDITVIAPALNFVTNRIWKYAIVRQTYRKKVCNRSQLIAVCRAGE